ncbi:MAG: hypothetical protein ITG00_05765 [Flavobacterium sp.]|nr:hypothetical protein [Flavobacterium sp.]
MDFKNKSPEELKASREREQQEFAEAERRAQARAEEQQTDAGLDPSAEIEPSQTPKFQQQHGNRKYSMFSNESSADNVARTRTDTHIQ